MTSTTAPTSPKPLDIALGANIRQRRRALGVSQSSLADVVGLTFQQIQKYERGTNRVSFSRLVDIAHALDCRVIELIGDLDDSNASRPTFRDETHLRVDGGAELLAAYAVATRPLQQVIRKLVLALADDQRGRAPESAAGEQAAAAS